MNNLIFLDIETRPQQDLVGMYESELKPPSNYKSEEAIKKWKDNQDSWKAMAVDPDYCEIRMIGIKELGKKVQVLSLEEFAKYVSKLDYVTFITYNGKSFDFPAIIKAGIKNNLKMPYQDLKKLTLRYPKFTGFKHIDLQEELNQYGKWKSLDRLLQIYLGIKKKEIDFKTCTIEELTAHVIEDCENSEKIYLKFKDTLII